MKRRTNYIVQITKWEPWWGDRDIFCCNTKISLLRKTQKYLNAGIFRVVVTKSTTLCKRRSVLTFDTKTLMP
jgi:hypothetical protein